MILVFCKGLFTKGLERQCLIGLTGDGFNHAWTTTRASALSVEPKQDYYIQRKCFPGSSGINSSSIIHITIYSINNLKYIFFVGSFCFLDERTCIYIVQYIMLCHSNSLYSWIIYPNIILEVWNYIYSYPLVLPFASFKKKFFFL